jgi:hypothetical protein
MRTLVLTGLVLASCLAAMAEEPAAVSAEQQASALAQEFVALLKPQLKKAMIEGGPTLAISACADLAPAIADSLSAQSGWSVERVSLKSRNPSRALPDSWERKVLLEFDARQAAGADAANIHFAEVVDGSFRYMQAQAVEPICLICHGKGLSDDVQQALQEYYPDDQAKGYSLGQVRGAISLSRSLQASPGPDQAPDGLEGS